MSDEDFYDPITEACWSGYKQVGMKKKGDRMVQMETMRLERKDKRVRHQR